MNRIHPLTPLLANQIAAGEVVARPASVVKELLENSLDAGATAIQIHIEQGGSQLIEVRDNGSGIHPDDLALALSRHATSKINDTQDLDHMLTFGFRGEALASIAAVSRLTLTSALPQQSGFQIAIHGDVLQTATPAAHPTGTTVSVRDLFYNTPARRKFLRSNKTEFDHIDEVVKQIAISAFNTEIMLKHDNRLIRHYFPASDLAHAAERLHTLCGEAFVEQALFIEAESAGLQLQGWIAQPNFNRSQGDMQYFYVNNRPIRDKLVWHAIKAAYQDVLYRDRHPAFILFLTLPPEDVDVNVHPTKHEVRFRQGRHVHDFVLHSVQQALATPCEQHMQPATPPQQTAIMMPTPVAAAAPVAPIAASYSPPPPLPAAVLPEVKQTHFITPPLFGRAIAQLKGTYILAENEKGFVLVDMHAAHERIVYERYKKAFAEQNIVTQLLLVPYTVTLSEREAEQAEAASDFFLKLGFKLARISQNTVAIREVPQLLAKSDMAYLLRDMLTDLLQYGMTARDQVMLNKLLGNLACRAALRAPHALSLAEMNTLLRDMEHTDHHGQCNHGRPTFVQLTMEGLDKLFLRGR